MNSIAVASLGLVLMMLCSDSMSAGKSAIPYDKPETEAFFTKLVTNVKSGNVVQVSAKSLGRQYTDNEVAADQKFKGKYVFVVGQVDSVRKSLLGDITVHLRSVNQFLPVDAELDKSVAMIDGMENNTSKLVTMKTVTTVEAASLLKKGQQIRMLCKSAGMVMGSPQLRVCDTISK